jgi:hypothetical protein
MKNQILWSIHGQAGDHVLIKIPVWITVQPLTLILKLLPAVNENNAAGFGI